MGPINYEYLKVTYMYLNIELNKFFVCYFVTALKNIDILFHGNRDPCIFIPCGFAHAAGRGRTWWIAYQLQLHALQRGESFAKWTHERM